MDDLKLSMWTSFLIDLSPEDTLSELADAGWRYTELSDEHSQALLERGEPEAVGKAFRRFADDCGVAVDQGQRPWPERPLRGRQGPSTGLPG